MPGVNAANKIIIDKENVVFVEGKDEQGFFSNACKTLNLKNIYIYNYEGINSKVGAKIKAVMASTTKDGIRIKRLAILRDIEQGTRQDAIRSIQGWLQSADQAVPDNEYEFVSNGDIETAFAVLPSPNIAGSTLEDLCLEILADTSTIACVEPFLECCEQGGQIFRQRHKNKLNSYLSGTDKFKGKNIGLSAKSGAFDFHCKAFKPFRDFLEQINS